MFTLCSALWQTVNSINNIQENQVFESAWQLNANCQQYRLLHMHMNLNYKKISIALRAAFNWLKVCVVRN